MAEEKQDREHRRKRARKAIALLLKRLRQICRPVRITDRIADQIADVVQKIRELAAETGTGDLLPEEARVRLQDAAGQFEQARDTLDSLAEACDRTEKALGYADTVLRSPSEALAEITRAALRRVQARIGALLGGVLQRAVNALPKRLWWLAGVGILVLTTAGAVLGITRPWESEVLPVVVSPTRTPTVATPVPDDCLHDDFDSAVVVTLPDFEHGVRDIACATTADDDPPISCGSPSIPQNSRSLWYRLRPSEETFIDITTDGSDYDTVVAVFVRARESLSEVPRGCNNNAPGTLQSLIPNLPVSAGTTYWIEVTEFGRPGASRLVLSIRESLTPTATPTATPVTSTTPLVTPITTPVTPPPPTRTAPPPTPVTPTTTPVTPTATPVTPPPPTGPLDVVDVGAPAINCVFSHNCSLTVSDSTDHFTLDGTAGDGFLQSRTFPPGEPGTDAEGLYGYEYRIDLSGLSGILHVPCITEFSLEFGPVFDGLDYDGNGEPDDVYVIATGGVGSVGIASGEQEDGTITLHLVVCPGESTYFFGITSAFPPRFVTAQLRDTEGVLYTLEARAP